MVPRCFCACFVLFKRSTKLGERGIEQESLQAAYSFLLLPSPSLARPPPFYTEVRARAEEVGSYVTSLQFLLCQQYVHRRECMGKNKDVARTKQNEGEGCFVSK